jgi:spore coat protein CotH
VDVRADESHLHVLDEDRSVRVPCDVTIDGERFRDATITEKGSIGSSSTLAEKPGFTIRFGDDRPEGMKKLTLNNARQDPTFLHEHMAYDLYRRAALPAPRTAHGVVALNRRAYGVYVMVEPKDERFLKRYFGAAGDSGNLYEIEVADFADSFADPVSVTLKNGDDDAENDPFERADLRALADAVRTEDEQFAAAVSDRLDLGQFITAYAIDGLMAHWDGPMFGINNYYLYKNPADGRFVLFPHGADQVFDPTFDPLSPPKLLLAQRIRGIPALDAQLRGEMNRIMDTVWQVGPMFERIDRVRAIMGDAPSREEANARDVAQFLTFVDSLRQAIDARRAAWLGQPF